jgi:hypothetical protein
MAWGIRGQYGHETGAMIAGLLLSSTLVLLFGRGLSGVDALRAVAWTTIAMGFGGSMTYGQTVGLTHDAELVGNHQAWGWGMLGLAIKGGLWIGFGGTFLGMGLGGKRYREWESLWLMLGLLGLCWIGIQALNEPFNPSQRRLPPIYFSDDWRWEPGAVLKPRREVWGGMLAAWIGLLVYVRYARRDGLGLRLGLWGFLGGALGFPLGQALQSYHAWHLDFFRSGVWAGMDPLINWWNWMETTFGAIMGGVLGLGLWVNRHRIHPPEASNSRALPSGVGWGLLMAHVSLLVGEQFFSVEWLNEFYDFGLVAGLIPIVAVAGDARWSSWMIPVTVLPIAGKTLREMVYEQHAIAPWLGWVVYLVIPLGMAVALAVWLQRDGLQNAPAARSLRPVLLAGTWLFFGLNYAFFRFPWPWNEWTARTPNSLAFTACALALSWLVFRSGRGGFRKSLSC